jgi:hypothetical protein
MPLSLAQRGRGGLGKATWKVSLGLPPGAGRHAPRALVRLDDLADLGQAKTATVEFLLAVQAHERLEDLFFIFRRNTDAVVLEFDQHLSSGIG